MDLKHDKGEENLETHNKQVVDASAGRNRVSAWILRRGCACMQMRSTKLQM